tara:strand:+ start:434 stop:715 length:282 start_codon:yes stop_codon:yes gene_type:complete
VAIRNDVTVVTDQTKRSSAQVSPVEKAKLRLEIALASLEEVLKEKVAIAPETDDLSKDLDTAKREIADLQMKNLTIATRLDKAIDKMKVITGD